MHTILSARALLNQTTPLSYDCGALCGRACCAPDEAGQGGVYLFPGEDALLRDCGWGRVTADAKFGFGEMLLCDAPCEREKRPFACRMFPLTPIPLKSGGWSVRMDWRAQGVCPLAQSGVNGLDPAFVAACKQAVALLAKDPETLRFLRKWHRLERQYRDITL